jgi:predicted nucleotidyltransferase component of viral defense system
MKLHQNKQLFIDAVNITAQQLNIPPVYIEKDYWVTLALQTLFNSEISDSLVFKGGTALSKCFGLIERFSEDIDLVLLNSEGLTGNQKKTIIKKVSKIVDVILPEVQIDGLTHKTGQIRKTAHNYTKVFKDSYGQVRDVVVLEVNWIGEPEPFESAMVSSYVFDMMKAQKQEALIEEYAMQPFSLKVLDIKRTLCEKIMSLVRFSYGDNPISDLENKVRHTYDIYMLFQKAEIRKFFESTDFDNMLKRVANSDVLAYKDSRYCLQNHPKEALIFKELDQVWAKLKVVYNNEFKNLVFGELPEENDVLRLMQEIKERLSTITWNTNEEI